MTAWVCMYCMIAGKVGPTCDDGNVQAAHIESEHHIPIRRPHETPGEAQARFAREYPEAGGPRCRCPSCTIKRGLSDHARFAQRKRPAG